MRPNRCDSDANRSYWQRPSQFAARPFAWNRPCGSSIAAMNRCHRMYQKRLNFAANAGYTKPFSKLFVPVHVRHKLPHVRETFDSCCYQICIIVGCLVVYHRPPIVAYQFYDGFPGCRSGVRCASWRPCSGYVDRRHSNCHSRRRQSHSVQPHRCSWQKIQPNNRYTHSAKIKWKSNWYELGWNWVIIRQLYSVYM